MKKLISIIAITYAIASCNSNSKNDKIDFNPSELRGNYKLNIAKIYDEADLKKDTSNNFVNAIQSGFELMIKSVDIQVSFGEDNKGKFSVDGGLFKAFGDKKKQKEQEPSPFFYEVRNDSVIYFHKSSPDSLEKFGVIKSIDEDYSKLLFTITKENEVKTFELDRIE